jgi:hypothetical protein
VQRDAIADGVDPQLDDRRLARLGQRARHDPVAKSSSDGHLGHRRDGVRIGPAHVARCVDVPGVGHREHVAALVVDRFEVAHRRAVRIGRCSVHEIADGTLDRLPGQPHLTGARLGPQSSGRRKIRRCLAGRLVTASRDSGFPVVAGRCGLGLVKLVCRRHGWRPPSLDVFSPRQSGEGHG